MHTLTITIICIAVALALFLLLKLGVQHSWSYGTIILVFIVYLICLIASIQSIVMLIITGNRPRGEEAGLKFFQVIDSPSEFLALSIGCTAVACGIGYLQSSFLDNEHRMLLLICFISLLIGSGVLLIGFFIFFKGLALLLGIVATIISIFVGLKKLKGGSTSES